MNHFICLKREVDVTPVLLELQRNEHLWNQNPARRLYENSPHVAADDIWCRFRPISQLDGDIQKHQEEYRCEFWPAWYELPSLRPLVFGLAARVQAVEMGSVLITRLGPGAHILPHADRNGFAPNFYTTKLHVALAGSAVVIVEKERSVWHKGEVWTFDNRNVHGIENNGSTDRISLIISLRCE